MSPCGEWIQDGYSYREHSSCIHETAASIGRQHIRTRCDGAKVRGCEGATVRRCECAVLFDRDNLNLSFPSKDSDTHVVWMALEADIDAGIAYGEIRQTDPIERFGESSTRERDAAPGGVHVHAERGGQ